MEILLILKVLLVIANNANLSLKSRFNCAVDSITLPNALSLLELLKGIESLKVGLLADRSCTVKLLSEVDVKLAYLISVDHGNLLEAIKHLENIKLVFSLILSNLNLNKL